MRKELDLFSIDITYKCNLRCLHCYNSSGTHELGAELSDEEFLSIINEISKLRPHSLCFCGGEPLIRKDLLIDVIKLYNSSNPIAPCNMVTNGMLLTDSIVSDLKNAGIGSVQVSLDGVDSKTHNWIRKNDKAHEKAIEGIKVLIKNNMETAVACAPTKKSVNEIEELIDYCFRLGVSTFRVQPLMDLGRGNNIKDFILDESEYFHLSRRLAKKGAEVAKGGMLIDWGDPISHLKEIKNTSKAMTFLHITAYGDLMISPYLPISFGNIRKHTLTEYIEAGIQDLIHNEAIKKIVGLINSADDMQMKNKGALPEIFSGEDIVLDIIDDDINLKTMEILKMLESSKFVG